MVAPRAETPPQPGACGMPQILWGIGCLRTRDRASGAAVVEEFRQAVLPLSRQLRGAADNVTPRVELFRLVPITDLSGELKGDDQVLCRLPDSTFDCAAIEDICQRCDDAEVLAERVRESLMTSSRRPETLDERTSITTPSAGTPPSTGRGGLISLEMGRQTSRSGASPLSSPRGGGSARSAAGGSAREASLQHLRDENGALQRRLWQSEVLQKELKEAHAALQADLERLRQSLPANMQASATDDKERGGGSAVTIAMPASAVRLPLACFGGGADTAAGGADGALAEGKSPPEAAAVPSRRPRWF
ncbi:unnamed protein product [Prorocentrum cordatum]|uniref:Uncharacterized protein n=1 Tax=Prorocentrum cordatum TaxID=2364126 RepID=A0ABN9W8A2_9DINO|nr:unnamed protein product [Polarella glacialis]